MAGGRRLPLGGDQAWRGIVEHLSVEAGASEPADGIRPIGHDEVSLTLQHEVPSKSVGAARMSAINWPALRGDMEQAEELLGHLRSDSQKLDTYYESTREFARISLGRRIITAADAGRAMRLSARRHAPAQVPSIRRSDWR